MRISPIEYKSQIRDSINNIFTIEFKIVRRIFPILLGVYKALYFKYQDNTILLTHEKIFLSCFQKNLPGIETQHTKIAGQTFDQIFCGELKTGGNRISSEQTDFVTDKIFIPNYFTSSKQNFQEESLSNFLDSDQHRQTDIETNFCTKKIHFYENATIISPSFNWNKKQKKLYLGLFRNKSQPGFVDKGKKNAGCYQLENNGLNIAEKESSNYLSYFPSISIPPKQLVKGKLITRKYKKFVEFSNRESAIQQNSTKSTFFNLRPLQVTNKPKDKFKDKTNKLLLLNKHTNLTNKIYSNLDEVPVKLNSKYILDPKAIWNFLCSGSSVPRNILVDSPASPIFLLSRSGPSQSIRKISLGEKSYRPLPSSPSEASSQKREVFGPDFSSEVGLQLLRTRHYDRVAKRKYSIAPEIFSNAKIEQLKKKKFKVKSSNELSKLKQKKFCTLKIFFITLTKVRKNFVFSNPSKGEVQPTLAKQVRSFCEPEFFRAVSEEASLCWQVVVRNPGVVPRSYEVDSQGSVGYPLEGKKTEDFFYEPASLAKISQRAKRVNQHLSKIPPSPPRGSYVFFTQPPSMDLEGIASNPNILLTPQCGKQKSSLLLNKTKTKSGYFHHFIKQYSSTKNITWVVDDKILSFMQGIKPSRTLRNMLSLSRCGPDFSNFLTYPEGSTFLSEPASSEQALKSLKILEKYINLNKNIILAPRLMSGYKLPDSATKLTLLQFKKKLQFKKIHDFYRIEIPKNSFLSFMQNINLKSVEPYKDCLKLDPTLNFMRSIKSRSVNPLTRVRKNFVFSNPSKGEVLPTPANIPFKLLSEKLELEYEERPSYNGPGIFGNEITHELQITNPTKLKESYKQFLSSDNPLIDCQQSFFGKYFLETKLMMNEFHSNRFSPKIAIKKPLFFRKKYVRFTTGLFSKNDARKLLLSHNEKFWNRIVHSPSRIFSAKRFPYIAYVNQSEWATVTAKQKTSDKLVSPELSSITDQIFPFKSIFQIDNGIICRPLNHIDFTWGSDKTSLNQLFDSQSSGRVGNQFQPVRLTQTEKPIFRQTYKKTNTMYINKNFGNKNNVLEDSNNNRFFKINLSEQTPLLRQIFYQPFQPISYSSFLYVSQRYSFLLFFMYIFKDILKKYQQEIKSFLLGFIDKQNSSNENETDNVQWDLRIIENIKKNFNDIGGIDTILPELGEIVWFLRNSMESLPFSREKMKNTVSKAILLTGPPGTGKTLLVQAIAGEAKVPVLIESASSLIQPSKSFNGPERVKNLFAKAREIAPCIIFIDEIDTFGERRNVMMENPIFHNPILDAIYPSSEKFKNNVILTPSSSGLVNQLRDYHLTPKQNMFDQAKTSKDSQINGSRDQASGPSANKFKQTKTNLLMQLLIELDGVTNDKKVLVFAATNRPQILDSALIRPGRFNKTLDLKLPNKQKRIEIIKLYSGNMGVEKNTSLDYIANLTIGLSAADLASAINQSSIQAIQGETIHTIDTLEYGIQNITGVGKTSPLLGPSALVRGFFPLTVGTTPLSKQPEPALRKKSSKINRILIKQTNSVFINRIAYYQAGKVVVHTLLKTHPSITSINLWPETKSLRHYLINGVREKQFSQIYRRVELESRVIGLYAGKAGELVGLSQKTLFDSVRHRKNKQVKIQANSSSVTHGPSLAVLQSNLGIQDMSLASWLGEVMINRWHLYSKKLSTQNGSRLKENHNQEQNADTAITGFLQKESFLLNSLYKNLQNTRREVTSLSAISTLKKRVKHPWLQKRISTWGEVPPNPKKFEFLYSNKTDWYRIYSTDHKEDENTQYVLPDIYYHSNIYLKKLKKYKFANTKILVNNKFSSIVNWNEVYPLNRDYIYQSLLSTCFNKALLLIDQNRELLDLFATSLVRKEILREYEIHDIIEGFLTNSTDVNPCFDPGPKEAGTRLSQLLIKTKNISEVTNNGFQQNQIQNKIVPNVKKVENMWGKESRRRICKFVNFSGPSYLG